MAEIEKQQKVKEQKENADVKERGFIGEEYRILYGVKRATKGIINILLCHECQEMLQVDVKDFGICPVTGRLMKNDAHCVIWFSWNGEAISHKDPMVGLCRRCIDNIRVLVDIDENCEHIDYVEYRNYMGKSVIRIIERNHCKEGDPKITKRE